MSNQVSKLIGDIFDSNQHIIRKDAIRPCIKAKNVMQKEIELAVTVLLVDLASVDQNFDMQEYNTICNGLGRIFGTTREEVQALVNKANLIIANLRGTSRFADLLKQSLSVEQRTLVMEVINEVIGADGVQDGFEVYLKHKFTDLLGLGETKPA